MKTSLALCAIVGVVTAVLEINIAKQPESFSLPKRSRRSLVERQDATIKESTMNIEPWYVGGGFYMNVSVGTPGQVVTVAIYTLASVTFFDAQSSNECVPHLESTGHRPCAGGSFQTNFSSTYKVEAANGFNFTFLDRVVATGDLATDVIQIGDVAIANMRFGVAQHNSYEAGSIGLGYGLNYITETVSPYRSFLEQLQAAGAINSKIYSLLLNGTGTPTGSIVFGGIDVLAFAGELFAINFLPSTIDWEDESFLDGQNKSINGVTQPLVAITDIGITYDNGTKVTLYENGDPTGQANNSLPTVLDVTTASWGVSYEVFNAMLPMIPGLDVNTSVVPCEAANEKMNVTVSFGNSPAIEVPFANLVIPIFNAESNIQNTTSNNQPLCFFAVYPTTGTLTYPYPYVMGSSIMRSMYLVFDLDNAQLNIAQAAANDCADGCSDIVEVPAGPNGIARALASGYTTITVVTAPSNTGVDEALITASGISESITPVARTTDNGVGTAVGSAAIPSDGVATPQVVLTSGKLSAVTQATNTGSGATTTSSSAATHKAAAPLWRQSTRKDVVTLPSVVSITVLCFALALLL